MNLVKISMYVPTYQLIYVSNLSTFFNSHLYYSGVKIIRGSFEKIPLSVCSCHLELYGHESCP